MADALKNIFGGAKSEQAAAGKPDSGKHSSFSPTSPAQLLASRFVIGPEELLLQQRKGGEIKQKETSKLTSNEQTLPTLLELPTLSPRPLPVLRR
jgi:hypothetical protein